MLVGAHTGGRPHAAPSTAPRAQARALPTEARLTIVFRSSGWTPCVPEGSLGEDTL